MDWRIYHRFPRASPRCVTTTDTKFTSIYRIPACIWERCYPPRSLALSHTEFLKFWLFLFVGGSHAVQLDKEVCELLVYILLNLHWQPSPFSLFLSHPSLALISFVVHSSAGRFRRRPRYLLGYGTHENQLQIRNRWGRYRGKRECPIPEKEECPIPEKQECPIPEKQECPIPEKQECPIPEKQECPILMTSIDSYDLPNAFTTRLESCITLEWRAPLYGRWMSTSRDEF